MLYQNHLKVLRKYILIHMDFVLSQYVKQGVDELNQEKLRGLLELKYQSIHDATKALGNPNNIRKTFIDFQKYLYQSIANS